jgi:hypothetical protein
MVATTDHPDRVERWIQWIGAAAAAGVVGGLAAGVAARVAMRVFAEAIGRATEFTVAGTLGILAVGAMFGSVFGIGYPAMRRLLPRRRIVSGILFGLVMAVAVVVPVLSADGDEAAPDPELGIRLGVVVVMVFAIVTAAADAVIRRRLGDRDTARTGLALLAALALFSSQLVVPALGGASGRLLDRVL